MNLACLFNGGIENGSHSEFVTTRTSKSADVCVRCPTLNCENLGKPPKSWLTRRRTSVRRIRPSLFNCEKRERMAETASQGSRVTSDGGLILVRELDERLGQTG